MTEVVLTALKMVFVVSFVRALPWPARWLTTKPLSCDPCMLGWCAIAAWWFDAPWQLLSSAGLAWLLLQGARKLQVVELPPIS